MNRRPRHNVRGERMVDLFAEALSIHGTVAVAAKSLDINRDYGRTLFKRIKRELGLEQCR